MGYIAVCAVAVLCTFSIIYQSYKARYEQRRFSDVSIYLERMIYYFSSGITILDSLELIIKLFPSGEMHDVLNKAINIIRTSNVAEVDKAALAEMLSLAKKYFLRTEETGLTGLWSFKLASAALKEIR